MKKFLLCLMCISFASIHAMQEQTTSEIAIQSYQAVVTTESIASGRCNIMTSEQQSMFIMYMPKLLCDYMDASAPIDISDEDFFIKGMRNIHTLFTVSFFEYVHAAYIYCYYCTHPQVVDSLKLSNRTAMLYLWSMCVYLALKNTRSHFCTEEEFCLKIVPTGQLEAELFITNVRQITNILREKLVISPIQLREFFDFSVIQGNLDALRDIVSGLYKGMYDNVEGRLWIYLVRTIDGILGSSKWEKAYALLILHKLCKKIENYASISPNMLNSIVSQKDCLENYWLACAYLAHEMITDLTIDFTQVCHIFSRGESDFEKYVATVRGRKQSVSACMLIVLDACDWRLCVSPENLKQFAREYISPEYAECLLETEWLH
jgi:hypothetical protein